MKHANAYVAQLIALYQLALAEYIKANKDTLDEIQAKMKDTVLRNVIVWSNASPQDAPNVVKQLCNDPDNIAANFKSYISGFSSDVQNILKKLDMEDQIKKMDDGDCLLSCFLSCLLK